MNSLKERYIYILITAVCVIGMLWTAAEVRSGLTALLIEGLLAVAALGSFAMLTMPINPK